VLVVTGHTTTFLIAARAAGVTASPMRLVAPTLLVLLAMGVPANVGGWGPREGAAAWAFAAAGLGADLGVSTAVVYGVMALVANLPGGGLLALSWARTSIRGTLAAGGAGATSAAAGPSPPWTFDHPVLPKSAVAPPPRGAGQWLDRTDQAQPEVSA
jgi:glycosyltransferase 2 family protein